MCVFSGLMGLQWTRTGGITKMYCIRMMVRRLKSVASILLLVHVASVLVGASPSSDAHYLVEFQKGILQDHQSCLFETWNLNSLDSGGCPLRWCGVECSDGMVTTLNLGGLTLMGEIRPGTLGKLSMLTSLVFSDNQLAGNLPDDIGKLGNLKHLDLSNNLLNGSIPGTLGHLPKMVNLFLGGNNFNGKIPDNLCTMESLVTLDLSRNSLSGSIPSSWNSQQLLSSLNLSFNELSGTIPKELANLKYLTALDLHHNLFKGSLDSPLMSFLSLQHVDLSCNQLLGSVTWQEVQQPRVINSLMYVNLSNNQLTGPLAQERFAIVFAGNLTVLDVSNNRFSGELPSFEYLYSLEILNLRNNLFSGAIPQNLLSTSMPVLKELDLSKNRLSGEIGSIMSTSLSILNLSSNLLYGAVPTKLGSCMVVDLSYNKFSGNLSAMYGWGDSLGMLDLSFNDLTGELPDQIAKFVRLTNLNLSHNRLSGSIPNDFGSYPKISVIDLSSNQLDGIIPTSFFNSSTLSYLSLSNNQLFGSIQLHETLSATSDTTSAPSSTMAFSPQADQLSRLQVLDLSSNKLNGSIPEDIGSYEKIESLNLSHNQISGNIPDTLCNLSLLQDLDLSDNQLSGHIPESLPESLLELDLSKNNLSGTIPSTLSKFPLSSFFPGNEGLCSTNSCSPWHFDGPGIAFGKDHRRGIGTAVKAGLIGGCTAGITLVVVVGMLLYYRKSRDYGIGSELCSSNKDIGNGHKIWSPCAAYFAFHDNSKDTPPIMSSSADLLLAAAKGSPATKSRGTRETGAPCVQDVKVEGGDSSKVMGLELSPSRTKWKSSPGSNNCYESSGESLPAESPIILKVRSPDRLAGDLYFLDSTLIFTAEELSRAPAEVLGRSSHGTSYKATLDNGHVLTVKWLREGLAKSKRDFAREAKKFGKIRHPNVIPLRGYYWGPREHEKLIISDHVSSGSLAVHLYESTGRRFPPLSWQQRLLIAVDIARGLSYLHFERHLPHGNLKATNVLLDGQNLNGRLADYGLHQLMTSEGTANQILNAGALGYRAPELATMKKPKPSYKGDVYAFGVLMMEILTGKSAGDIISGHCGAVDLTDWVRLLATEGRSIDCFDPDLVGSERDQEPPKGIDDMLALALKCILPQSERPSIRSVYEELTSITT